MKEERSPWVFFLASVLLMAVIVALLWPYLWEILEFLGILVFAVLMIVLILGIAALLASLILIPFFAVKHPAEVREGDYRIEDAVEPGVDEKD